ncbi:MAG: GTPase Obg [Candidatus Anoxychlamydiales bacterium]|nr:GTPase Obg [Candidatus Anoxychlamydiales bacterium]
MFLDNIKLKFIAGKGGDGIVAWRREKYLPKGGPYGGDGGKGGSIIIEADEHLISLEKFKFKKIIKAIDGNPGGTNNKIGKNGKDLTIIVPLGTIFKDPSTKEILFEVTNKKDKFVLCKGGKGGRGNIHFKTSTNQAPNIFTKGAEGEELVLKLKLKLIADIGLVGLPNARKSTLMSKLTNNKVKIASYPFTTLFPNIGLLEFEDFSRIFLADIPGIIKDAHLNKGLGVAFLKHIERTSMLLFIVDVSFEDAVDDFKILQKEINCYNPDILKKPFLILLNKIDLLENNDNVDLFKKEFNQYNDVTYEISANEKIGFEKVLSSIYKNFKNKNLFSKV